MKNIKWKVSVFNPTNPEDCIDQDIFSSVEEIYNSYPHIPLSTWRNIAIGRSKVYKNFITIEKCDVSNLTNNDYELPPPPTIVEVLE